MSIRLLIAITRICAGIEQTSGHRGRESKALPRCSAAVPGVYDRRAGLIRLCGLPNAGGKAVVGLDASTEGNVMLPFRSFTGSDAPLHRRGQRERVRPPHYRLAYSYRVEGETRARKPDPRSVLPWRFEDGSVAREHEPIGGGKMIFPLPEIEIV